ncbi:MAG: hypothetical protein AAFV53_20730 [Myxococcota bacterium]
MILSLLSSLTAMAGTYASLDELQPELQKHIENGPVYIGLQGDALVQAWSRSSLAANTGYRPSPVQNRNAFDSILSLNQTDCGMLVSQSGRDIQADWVCVGEPIVTATRNEDVVLVDTGPTVLKDKRRYTNMITPGYFLPLGLKVRYHRLLSDRFSVIVGGGLSIFETSGTEETEGVSSLNYMVMGGGDLHILGNGFDGLFVGPRVLFRSRDSDLNIIQDSDGVTSNATIARMIIGYRVVVDPGLSASLGIGGSVRAGENSSGSQGILTLPALEFNLSWAF